MDYLAVAITAFTVATLTLFFQRKDSMALSAVTRRKLVLPKIPVANKVLHVSKYFGTRLEDVYNWLRSTTWPDGKPNKEIINYVQEENKYCSAFFNYYAIPIKNMIDEIKGRIKLTDTGIPVQEDEFLYYIKSFKDKNYTTYYRRKVGEDPRSEEMFFDKNEIAKNRPYMNIGTVSVFRDHKYLAYSVDFQGNEEYQLVLRHIRSKQEKILLSKFSGDFVWNESRFGIFYTEKVNGIAAIVKYCNIDKISMEPKYHNLLYHENQSTYTVGIARTSDRKYLIISSSSKSTNNEFLCSLYPTTTNNPRADYGPLTLVTPEQDKVLYHTDHGQNTFFVITNNQSPNFKILAGKSLPINSTWKVMVQERTEAMLQGFNITKTYFCLSYNYQALPKLSVSRYNNDTLHTPKRIDFPEEAYAAGIHGNYRFDHLQVIYEAPNRPTTIYKYDYTLNTLTTLKISEVPSGHNPSDYV
eukprot:Pgem_evm6s2